MKTITILSAILFLSFSSNSVEFSSKYMIQLTKDALLADKIELVCQDFNDGQKFSIKGFSIKLPGHPVEVINGASLNATAKSYMKDLKINQMVSIYDIKSAYDGDQLITTKDIPSFYIKIIEEQNTVVMID